MMRAVFSISGAWFMVGLWFGAAIGIVIAGLLAPKKDDEYEEMREFVREILDSWRRDFEKMQGGPR